MQELNLPLIPKTIQVFTILFFLVISIQVLGQDTLFLRGRFDEESLKLRWSCTSLEKLIDGFRSGYMLSVYQIDGDQKIFVSSHRILAGDHDVINQSINTQADSAAYAVLQELVDQGTFFDHEEVQRWKFLTLIFGLQDNFLLTKALGMGAELTNLDRSRKYRIEIDLIKSTEQSTLVREDLETVFPHTEFLPEPETLTATCTDNRVTLTGVMTASTQYYSSYRLERDTFIGNNFVLVNRVPLLVNYASGEPLLFFIDTIIESRPTRYRLQGKDIWGNWGPYSDTLVVDPCHLRLLPPHPFSAEETEERGSCILRWEVPDSIRDRLVGFEVYRSSEKFKGYQKLVDLPAHVFEYRDSNPLLVGYYYVEVIYENNHRRKSLSDIVALIDTRPPPVPENVQVNFDTVNLITTIRWDSVKALDLSGYRIFYSDQGKDGHKFLLDNLVRKTTTYQDTIDQSLLAKDRYYWITSRDFSGNESLFSNPGYVRIPDRFPPVPARITDLRLEWNRVEVYWVGSPSHDAVLYFLERRQQSATAWKSQQVTNENTVNQFIDSTLLKNDTVHYRIRVLDSSGLSGVSNVRAGWKLSSPWLPDLHLISVQRTDSTVVIFFDYPENIDVRHFRLRSGNSPDGMQTRQFIFPLAVLIRTGIQKDDFETEFNLYRCAIMLDPDHYFQLQAIARDGRISRYSEPVR